MILVLTYFVTLKVLYTLLKIKCSMRGPSILISNTTIYVRDEVAQGKLKVCKISTYDNPADIITKPVPIAKFELCSSLVGITV
jgi:hypothetical protein